MLDHWQIFEIIAPYFGRDVPARFIQKTSESIPDVERIHNLIEGIYKPVNANYALAIASTLKNPYADRIEYRRDRTWSFYYSPKAGSLDSAVNQSLFNCMRDGEPVLVIKQLSDKTHAAGTRYKILGLGRIESFDSENRLFRIAEVTIDEFQQKTDPGAPLSDNLIETALRLEALEEWAPFVSEDRAVYRVAKAKRDAAFRKIVLANYYETCAVTQQKFVHKHTVEAQAAHVISKSVNGSDDPRNGIAMSHTAHWAFDQGIFTISDQYEILVHPSVRKAEQQNFVLADLDRRPIVLPTDDSVRPHLDALAWHRDKIFGHFAK